MHESDIVERDTFGARCRGHQDSQNLLATGIHTFLQGCWEVLGVHTVKDLTSQITLLGIFLARVEGVGGFVVHVWIFHPLSGFLHNLVGLPSCSVQYRRQDAQSFQ